jgi:hypothetical protein
VFTFLSQHVHLRWETQANSTFPLSLRRSLFNFFGSPRPLHFYVMIDRVGALGLWGPGFDLILTWEGQVNCKRQNYGCVYKKISYLMIELQLVE